MTETMSFYGEGRSGNTLVELTCFRAPKGKYLSGKNIISVG